MTWEPHLLLGCTTTDFSCCRSRQRKQLLRLKFLINRKRNKINKKKIKYNQLRKPWCDVVKYWIFIYDVSQRFWSISRNKWMMIFFRKVFYLLMKENKCTNNILWHFSLHKNIIQSIWQTEIDTTFTSFPFESFFKYASKNTYIIKKKTFN